MHQVWPSPARTLDDADLEELYRYPVEGAGRWLAVNLPQGRPPPLALDVDPLGKAWSGSASRGLEQWTIHRLIAFRIASSSWKIPSRTSSSSV